MPFLSLTKAAVEKLPFATQGQILYRDPSFRGFGLRVGQGSKVWFVEGQVGRRTKRVTIGRADVIAPDTARKKAASLLQEMSEGVDPTEAKRRLYADTVTLDKAFGDFFVARPNLAATSRSSYERSRSLYLKNWANRRLNEITRQMVLTEHHRISVRHGKPTANAVFRHLRSVYNVMLATNEGLPPNPVDVLSLTRSWHPEKRRRRLLEVHQLPAWWKAIHEESSDARDVLLVGLFTGMRRSEILTLKWSYVDLAGKALHIPTTKNGDPLDLPLSTVLVKLFEERRRAQGGNSLWVFPGVGQTGHITETKTFVARVAKRSGVPFSLHDLRRTFITIAESLDISAYALKKLLNHRSGADVTSGYIVVNTERLRKPVEEIAQHILRLATTTAPTT